MHIAICDDTIADRKQLERLLQKLSPSLTEQGISLYIDSYGNTQSLMKSPHIYDAFYLDFNLSSTETFSTVTQMLRKDGITAPIFSCSSKRTDRTEMLPYDNVFFINKPILLLDLQASIEQIQSYLSHLKKTFEIRSIEKTFYINEEDFVYGIYVNNRQSTLYFQDGTHCELPDDLDNLKEVMSAHPSLMLLKKGYLVNTAKISAIHLFQLTLNEKINIPLKWYEYGKLKRLI